MDLTLVFQARKSTGEDMVLCENTARQVVWGGRPLVGIRQRDPTAIPEDLDAWLQQVISLLAPPDIWCFLFTLYLYVLQQLNCHGRKSTFNSTSHDRYISQVCVKNAFCGYFCQYHAVYVVRNTNVRRNFGQILHCFVHRSRLVYSSQVQIAHFDRKMKF